MTEQSTQTIDDMLSDIWSDLNETPPPESCLAKSGLAQADGEAEATASSAATPSQSTQVSQQVQSDSNQGARNDKTTQPAEAKSDEPTRDAFTPPAPKTLREAGSSEDETSRLILKLLAARGGTTGRGVSGHIKLPFGLIERVLSNMRREQLLVLKGEAIAGDYTYVITEKGLGLAKELTRECTYFGSAPVSLKDYVDAMEAQTINGVTVRAPELKKAFSDLLLEPSMLLTLGPAVNSGRGLFLFGEPGNGKTSIAERVSRAFGSLMWIPRALGIDGQIIRVYDPAIHEEVPLPKADNNMTNTEVDHRWVRIKRPTVVAGGELTMAELEVTQDASSKICEAPLQLKSNGGVLLIDDFGRQRMPVDELLNRWIVPLEKRYDLLNLPSGKKVQVPFDQLVIFSTNLEPNDLVDDAFLRRIPYKIEVPNPSTEHFAKLFEIMCKNMGFEFNAAAVDYLIKQHYQKKDRPLRACHPRDLLLQIRNYCKYQDIETKLTRESIDFAVNCYFSVLT
jgi:predicted ATPase with chaperone activity